MKKTNIQPHIKLKKGDIAEYVLIPGDPARVEKIAKYWDKAKIVGNNRGFLAYTGEYQGISVSAISTGIGCPSAAIVVEELISIGAKVLIRVGTCGALKSEIKPGNLIIPFASIREEGTTKEYLPPEVPALADFEVTEALKRAAQALKFKYFKGINRTHDAFYEPVENMLKWGRLYKDERMKGWPIPLVSSEMECSAVFLIGMLRGIKTGAVLAVVTTESLLEISKNPSLVYQLIETKDAKGGINHAIQVALQAIKLMEKKKLEER